ncbi:hypothetical protein Ahy_A08g037733 isoform B [Arachis hypogaea]|uniref:Uncharacterized protein n=1 Tax=Arachis hypogaea TaxID=3818 RepID=A0A445BRL9_ARAHY|nr:hypothetical protein Ahy_A08g037733 isoform B [Arachis hypogaea]
MTNIIFLICLCLHFCNQAESLVGLILYSILIVIMKITFVMTRRSKCSLHHVIIGGLMWQRYIMVYVHNILDQQSFISPKANDILFWNIFCLGWFMFLAYSLISHLM